VIVISRVIADILSHNYGRRDTNLVFNGVPIPIKSVKNDYITSFGLEPKKYILALGRFVEEKGFHHLIEAWGNVVDKKGYKLVIAGDADHEDDYSRRLKQLAKESGVVLTGFIKGEKLNEILTHAGLFILPSSHEGLPISLLEAMSYNLDSLVSDIPANKIPSLSEDDFFHCGDIDDLCLKIKQKLDNLKLGREYDLSLYNWDNIALQTLEVYNTACK
jgi:glycosyltransferase involved in cell wall biosynthesis